MPDELADLQPSPEVVALGRPDQVFRLEPGMRNFIAWGGQALGLAMVLVPLIFMSLAVMQGQAGLVGLVGGLVILILGALLFLKAEQVRRSPVYAFYPEALALYQDGAWSVIAWDDVRAFEERSGLAFFPSLALRDGRAISLRNDLFDSAPFYSALRNYANCASRPRREASAARHDGPRPSVSPALSVGNLFADLRKVLSSRNAEVRRDLWIGGALILAGLLLLGWNGRWILSALRGPTPMTLAELDRVGDPAELANPWVTITSPSAVETDLEMLRENKYGWQYQEAQFFLIPVQDRWLIAEMPPEHGGGQFVGYLDTWGTPLRMQAIDAMRARVPDGAALVPFQLDGVYGYRPVRCLGGDHPDRLSGWGSVHAAHGLVQRSGRAREAQADGWVDTKVMNSATSAPPAHRPLEHSPSPPLCLPSLFSHKVHSLPKLYCGARMAGLV